MTKEERDLFDAIKAGNIQEIKDMVRTKRELLSAVDNESDSPLKGDNPIHRACRLDNIAIVDALLDAGDNIERDKLGTGTTSIFIAASKGHVNTLNRLIKRGANVNAVCNADDNTFTPIFYAITYSKRIDVLDALISAGADIYFTSKKGSTTFSCAAKLGNQQLIDALDRAHKLSQAKLQAQKNDLEKQKAELKKQEAALAAKAGKIQSEIKDMEEKHKQDEINYLSKVSNFVLDQYKSAAVDGVDRSHQFEEMQRYNREVLAKLSPNAQQAYADARKKQPLPAATGQTTAPGVAPVRSMA